MTARLAAWLKSITDGIAAVGGAGLFSQLPEFAQQYLQRLGGHRDEALRFVQVLRTRGADAANGMLAVAEARAADLSEAVDAIAAASDLTRPLAFLRHFDPDIARATLDVFRPAVPLTPAGLIYGGCGLVLGVALLYVALAPFKWLWRRRVRA
jgi:Protein of unknown function (DUF2937)